MKLAWMTSLSLLLAVALAAPAFAGEGEGGRRGGRGEGKRGGGKAKCERLFQKFDQNEDGALTSDEVPEKLWTRISKADADGSGGVTKEELKAAHKERKGRRGRGGRGGGEGDGG